MKKSIFLGLLLVVLVASFAACSKKAAVEPVATEEVLPTTEMVESTATVTEAVPAEAPATTQATM
jgi:hypothetical protein